VVFKYENIKLNYEVMGDGIPIVIIHGLSCSRELMIGCMEPILKEYKGYKRIYVDLPGMGRSSAELNYAVSDKILEVLLAFINREVSGNFLLAGQSYGGYLARGILSVIPNRVDGLFLLCPVVISDKNKRKLPIRNVESFDESFFENISEKEKGGFLEYAVVANKYTYMRYKNEIEIGLNVANQEFIDELCENYEFGFDADKKINENKFIKPTLFIAGRQDDVVGYHNLFEILESYPRAAYYILDLAGHNLQIEQPQMFESLVHDWLKRVSVYL